MKTSASTYRATGKGAYVVFGYIRDSQFRLMNKIRVTAFDKDIRSEQPLGKPTHTDEKGRYDIAYTRKQFARQDKQAADVLVRVYDRRGKLLGESSVNYNAPAELQVDIDLSGRPYPGPSEFEQTVENVRPFLGRLKLSELAEDAKHQDITFLTNKTGLTRTTIETLAMAFRFEKNTKIEAGIFYGLIRQGPANNTIAQAASLSSTTTFDSKATQTFGILMRESIDTLMAGIQGAIDSNVIPYCVTAVLPKIKKELLAQQQLYLRNNPQPQAPSNLTMKLNIAGLQGEQVSTFINLFKAGAGSAPDFWTTLAGNPAFQVQQVSLLQSVFALSQLTGEQTVLTDALIKSENIQALGDLPKLAAYTNQDWSRILQTNKIQPPSGIPGQNNPEQIQN